MNSYLFLKVYPEPNAPKIIIIKGKNTVANYFFVVVCVLFLFFHVDVV